MNLVLLAAGAFLLVATGALFGGIALDLTPPLLIHFFLALAALPLMFAAILHFVPVLTRSGAPSRRLNFLPALVALAGLIALAAMAGSLPRHALLLAALLGIGAALTMIVWIVARLRAALGVPHPGARWYLVSLAALATALFAAIGVVLDPAHYGAWRALHLHLNLFGWIGLTVLGTLPVLLPTALGRPDPGAAARLRTDLKFASAAVLMLGSGAALGWPVLAAGGSLVLAIVLVLDFTAWLRLFAPAELRVGVPAALLLASLFLLVVLLAGTAHGFGLMPASHLPLAYVSGFLLPLVSAALVQLLPVWRFPGPRTPARAAFAAALARGTVWRGCILLAAGALAMAGVRWAPAIAAIAMLWLLLAVVFSWRGKPA